MLHYNKFQVLIEVVAHHRGTLYRDDAIIKIKCEKVDSKYDLTKATPDVHANFEAIACSGVSKNI